MARNGCFVLVVLLSSLSVGAETSMEAELYTLPCVPTAGVWYVPPGSSPQVVMPPLAVVDTDIRPERARLYLDGRFIGLADDFDGNPDYLYLKPGSYRLEGRLGGYVTAAFEIEARPGCRNHIRHALPRVPEVKKERRGSHPERPVPFKRGYEPVADREIEGEAGLRRGRGGPDPSLRPDLARRLGSAPPVVRERPGGASLRLEVGPAHASVYIDGAFVATGEELAKLVGPLAVEPGRHRLEVVAPGHAPQDRELVVAPGETLDARVFLVPLEKTEPEG